MAFKQEVNVPFVLTVGFISAILLIVAVIGTQAWFYSEEQNEIDRKNREYPNTELLTLKAGQTEHLTKYRWIDQKKGIVAIPIEAAMKIMVDSNGQPPEVDATAPSSSSTGGQ
jgi:hypothetical protein